MLFHVSAFFLLMALTLSMKNHHPKKHSSPFLLFQDHLQHARNEAEKIREKEAPTSGPRTSQGGDARGTGKPGLKTTTHVFFHPLYERTREQNITNLIDAQHMDRRGFLHLPQNPRVISRTYLPPDPA